MRSSRRPIQAVRAHLAPIGVNAGVEIRVLTAAGVVDVVDLVVRLIRQDLDVLLVGVVAAFLVGEEAGYGARGARDGEAGAEGAVVQFGERLDVGGGLDPVFFFREQFQVIGVEDDVIGRHLLLDCFAGVVRVQGREKGVEIRGFAFAEVEALVFGEDFAGRYLEAFAGGQRLHDEGEEGHESEKIRHLFVV